MNRRRALVALLLLVLVTAGLSRLSFVTAGFNRLSFVASGFSRTIHAAASPILVVETSKGTFTIQTFPTEAPKTVEHIVALARNRFYDGQRVHRALKGFVVQFGDPQSRDLAKRDLWGLGADASSGKPVGVSEITPKHTHGPGAVGLAHMGEPAKGDSQIYVTLAQRHDLDGKYAVFGQVVDGSDVPATLEVGDLITRISVRE
ncbi:MAG TPA: peptidylprolyl isomerase [Vicinamibacterales bacterium]|jgi:cyclophilin family peptidyl-prolyl cis-trans isomerase